VPAKLGHQVNASRAGRANNRNFCHDGHQCRTLASTSQAVSDLTSADWLETSRRDARGLTARYIVIAGSSQIFKCAKSLMKRLVAAKRSPLN
jgi:hypothetical protein